MLLLIKFYNIELPHPHDSQPPQEVDQKPPEAPGVYSIFNEKYC